MIKKLAAEYQRQKNEEILNPVPRAERIKKMFHKALNIVMPGRDLNSPADLSRKIFGGSSRKNARCFPKLNLSAMFKQPRAGLPLSLRNHTIASG